MAYCLCLEVAGHNMLQCTSACTATHLVGANTQTRASKPHSSCTRESKGPSCNMPKDWVVNKLLLWAWHKARLR